ARRGSEQAELSLPVQPRTSEYRFCTHVGSEAARDTIGESVHPCGRGRREGGRSPGRAFHLTLGRTGRRRHRAKPQRATPPPTPGPSERQGPGKGSAARDGHEPPSRRASQPPPGGGRDVASRPAQAKRRGQRVSSGVTSEGYTTTTLPFIVSLPVEW